jgi:hypothetical protein
LSDNNGWPALAAAPTATSAIRTAIALGDNSATDNRKGDLFIRDD